MAKISRRAVASPSSSASSTSVTSSSAVAASIPPGSANNIATAVKPGRISGSENSPNRNTENIGPISGTVLPDPLRQTANQFTITTTTAKYASHTAYPTTIDNGYAASPLPPYVHNKTVQAQILAAERERIRAEFFATYDVMTGVRIAATLGGFFGLMVFLIVWKSRSSSNETMKVLKDPKMAAVAAVCMQEEEEREIQEAIVATGMSIYPDEYDAIVYRRQRMLSLGNVSAPPMLNRGGRFSSVGGGGYSSLLEPPRRFSYSTTSAGGSTSIGRRKSGSESSRVLSNYPMGGSFGTDDYFMETEDELENNSEYPTEDPFNAQHNRTDSTKSKPGFLSVPLMGQDSRRSSAMTCCSTESSYLERRCSAFTLGLTNLPVSLQRKLSTASRTSSPDNWDYYYPDIQVIQPTPNPSPCPSERSIYEQLKTRAGDPATVPTTSLANGTPATVASSIAELATTSKTVTLNPAAIGTDVFRNANVPAPQAIVRKHSIAFYDPESAQSGRKQQIHSISADTVDMYPYNQSVGTISKPAQSAPPVGIHHGFHFTDLPSEDFQPRKLAVIEMQRLPHVERMVTPSMSGVVAFENNNNYPYTYSAAAATPSVPAATANSSSISIDSTPISLDKLNGSGSLGTISVKALFNAEKRAPLASLSSFKISSLEYQDSDLRHSIDEEDSVFVDSAADTDEDLQELSSDSEEMSFDKLSGALIRTDTILVAPSSSHEAGSSAGRQPLKYPIDKHFSVGGPSTSGQTASRMRRPLLQRHRTISASSSDRVSLLGQQLKEFPQMAAQTTIAMTPTSLTPTIPLETHFGSIISTNSPPMHQRRAQLLKQQYSDPQSLPTNTEEDTCSTLNTEVGGIGPDAVIAGGDSTTHTQHSSLNTVISIGRSTPSSIDNNQMHFSPPIGTPVVLDTRAQIKQQLPCSRLAEDPCASSISDSIINVTTPRQPIIRMPSSLKSLIIRGSSSSDKSDRSMVLTTTGPVSKSATNLSLDDIYDEPEICTGRHSRCPSVMLELPLIKLPTDESSDSSTASDDLEHSRNKSDESRDPSLPSSSRKWSKETLF